MNIFEAVKQSITTRQAAEHYDIKVDIEINGIFRSLFTRRVYRENPFDRLAL